MQRFRLVAIVVGSSLVFGASLAQARNDTAAQAAARAALQQQMTQMDNEQSAGSTNSLTPPATPSTPPPATPPPVPPPTPQFSTNVPVSDETESEMAPARMSQTNQPATAETNTKTNLAAMTMPPPSVLITNEAENYPVNPPMAPVAAPQSGTSTLTPPATPSLQPVALPPSVENNLPVPPQPNPATQQSAPPLATGQEPPPSVATSPGPSIENEPKGTNAAPGLETIAPPPLPISQQQQAELQSLLSRYMANQITPAQYQEQRAQILGQQ